LPQRDQNVLVNELQVHWYPCCYFTGKADKSKGAIAPFGQAVVAATVGVPHVSVRYVVDGGK
jgi:hypothetical protein